MREKRGKGKDLRLIYKVERLDPIDLQLGMGNVGCMLQGTDNRQVGIGKMRVLANNSDVHSVNRFIVAQRIDLAHAVSEKSSPSPMMGGTCLLVPLLR